MNVRFSEEAMRVPWYVVVNDLIGGWSVSHVDKPLSEQDHRAGEGELFDAASHDLARYIVGLHNARLSGQTD